jgi:hypothetical protein
MKNSLSQHLNESFNNKRVDESLILASIVCASCIGYAVTPMLNTDFFKSVGAGIGGLFSGIGGLFGNFGIGGMSKSKVAEIRELLKKNPDDLTGKEKALLQKYSKNKKLKDELSNNELKALNKALGTSSVDIEDTEDTEDTPKKQNDNDNDNNNDGNDDNDTGKDNDNLKYTPEMMSGLMLLAKKANESEKDKTKKAENEAMLNLLAACSYDKDGNEIPMEERLEKMKDIVGEDKWEDFKKDMEKRYEENKDNEEFKKALENAKKNISEKDIEQFVEETKKAAKTTLEQVAKEKEEQERIDKELEELEKEIDDNTSDEDKVKQLKEDIKKLQEERENLIKQSIVGKASPATADAVIKDKSDSDNDQEPKKDNDQEPKKDNDKESGDSKTDNKDDNEPKKDKDGNIVKKEEIEDPKTGKKMTVVTHTGPRGGKYYKSKNGTKVYVKENNSLSGYLNSVFS